MRITCPNCGAQYEVPDEVIPTEGRDVQCSNCGDTWFQAHPDHVAEQVEEVVEPAPPPPPPPSPESEVKPASPRRVDPEVADILREEAAHETRLRARESAALESQGELGLEQAQDDARAREQRDRMARMRGEPVAQPDRPRSRLLPDVEEINSALSKSDKGAAMPAPEPESSAVAFPVASPAKRGGFGRGFLTVVVVAVVLAVVYLQASRIAEAVPALAPALEGYTSAVNSARLWIDTKLNAYVPR
ncbi:MAG: zinc-ribbon domain-containing protein [Pseudooceanicola sp.]|nr:zinc-ribbon domain-containing protein [Pseudooceanicola sp.]